MVQSIRHRWEIVFLSTHPYGPKWNASRIARYLKCDRKTVTYWLKRYQDTGNVDDEPKPGRNRKTTEKEDKRIAATFEQNPTLSLRSMTSISSKRGININKDTFRSRIIEAGFQNVAPTKKPLLSERHVNARLKWAEENTSTDWSQVIFTDEASFHARVPPRRVWSKIGIKKIFRTVKHPVKVHVWGCLSAKGFGKLHIFTGILTGTRMCKIYQHSLLPSVATLVPKNSDWVLQEDNDPKHTSKVASRWKSENGVCRMSWPAMSPDTNPIESVWAILKSRVASKNPTNLQSLIHCIRKEWKRLPKEYAEKLVYGMLNRVQTLINEAGDYTRY